MTPSGSGLVASAPPIGAGCGPDGGSWCELLYRVTGVDWVARTGATLAQGAVRVLLILLIAVVIRAVVHRLIKRIVRAVDAGHAPSLLRAVRERASHGLGHPEGSGMGERRRQRAATIGSLLGSVASFMIYGTAFVLILGEFGVNLAPILASAGVIGVAVGFGAQNLVRDFLSGIFMMVEDQYRVGDEVDLGQVSGTVESIGLRVSTVRDTEGTLWYVRNGTVSRVGNASQHFSIALVDVPFGHSADIAHATEVAERAARAAVGQSPLSELLLGEVSVLGVQAMTAHGATLRVTVTTRPGQQATVRRTLFEAIAAAFNDADIPPPTLSGATPEPAA